MSLLIPPNSVLLSNNNPSLDQPHQQRRLPFEQLKRAVSSNRLCFLIVYDQVESLKNRLSDISATSIIEDHFMQQEISVTLSLVGHMGNKLN
jgi:hypothetical protein